MTGPAHEGARERAGSGAQIDRVAREILSRNLFAWRPDGPGSYFFELPACGFPSRLSIAFATASGS